MTRSAKKIICVLITINVYRYFSFSGIQHGINQLKERPAKDYVIMIIIIGIYNKQVGWYALSRDDYLEV
jgi:hypothetical protein